MTKSKSKTKSKLINSGSYGCVFYPKIPCEKEKKEKKKSINKKKATKLILYDESLYSEFKINKSIQKIKNYDEWTVLWEKKCLSPNYKHLKQISQIEKCIDPKKKN